MLLVSVVWWIDRGSIGFEVYADVLMQLVGIVDFWGVGVKECD